MELEPNEGIAAFPATIFAIIILIFSVIALIILGIAVSMVYRGNRKRKGTAAAAPLAETRKDGWRKTTPGSHFSQVKTRRNEW